MGIWPWSATSKCGSEQGVRIELKSKTDLCETKPYGPFSAGDNLDWTEELLGDCKDALFDPMDETISFFIKTDIDDEFCPISVKIILNDQTSTSYSLELPDGDYHNSVEPDYTNNITYTATKLPGKIYKLQSSSLIGQCAGHVTRFLKSYDFNTYIRYKIKSV